MAIYSLEVLFDSHRLEIKEKFTTQKSGTLAWYLFKALQFQYGFDLIKGTDKFDNEKVTQSQTETSKIIKNVAVNPEDKAGTIVIKIAGEDKGKLQPISDATKTSVQAYFEEIKYAGSRICHYQFLA